MSAFPPLALDSVVKVSVGWVAVPCWPFEVGDELDNQRPETIKAPKARPRKTALTELARSQFLALEIARPAEERAELR
jgi:hypothetical protein